MIPKIIKAGICIWLICFSFSNSYSQISAEYKKYTEEHPNSRAVRLKQETNVTIKLDKGKFDIVQEVFEEDLFLDKSAFNNSKASLYVSEFFELKEIEASSYVPENGDYRKIKVEEFKIKDELNESFHDGLKSVNFIYPNLTSGAKTSLKYVKAVKNPRLLRSFYFGDNFPIEQCKFTIKADKDVQLEFEEVNTENYSIQFTKTEGKKYNTYSWELNGIDEFEFEGSTPNFRYFVPHIIPRIKSYSNNGEEIILLSDVSDLYGWYYSLVKDLNTEETDKDLVETVEILTADAESDLDKVRAIYYWAQENIKYIAFEYALDGYIPRQANDVFKKKYGDCKDNSSILTEMLKIAGIEGYLTWIGTRDIPYTYSQVPTPMVDNHMIISYQENGKNYFLDATGRYMKLELPASFIQGKEAMVSVDKDSFSIKTIPIIPPTTNALVDKTTLQISDGKLQGKAVTEISGYKKIDYFYDLEEQSNFSELKEYYNAKFRKGNNSFLIDGFEEINKYDYDKDFQVAYNFSIDNHVQDLNGETYVNLNLNKNILGYRNRDDRKTTREYDYQQMYDYEIVFEIPEGYSVDYIPENLSVTDDLLDFSISYEQAEGTLIYRHSFKSHFLTLSLEEQEHVNTLLDKAVKSFKEVIVLNKI